MPCLYSLSPQCHRHLDTVPTYAQTHAFQRLSDIRAGDSELTTDIQLFLCVKLGSYVSL